MSGHASLSAGRWQELSLAEQLGNIGSEVGRAIKAQEDHNDSRKLAALDRALELFDLTLSDERWRGRRRELSRAREVVYDFLAGDNQFRSDPEGLQVYFTAFALVARRER